MHSSKKLLSSKKIKKSNNIEFIHKILESKKQISEGKTIKIELKDLWK
jgi:hypothetical protein